MLMKGLKIYKYFNTNGSLSRTDVHILLLKMVMCIFFNIARRLLLECGPHTTKCCLQVYLLQRSTDERQKFCKLFVFATFRECGWINTHPPQRAALELDTTVRKGNGYKERKKEKS